jgi:uncharacterized membrane protein HdeD (DUF308 family)
MSAIAAATEEVTMTTQDSSDRFERFTRHVRRRWGWFLALGIIYVIGGLAAIVLPISSTLAFTLVVGIFLVISGIVQVIQGFQMREWQGVAWHLVMGVVSIIGGGYAIWNPLAGAIAITLVIAITFIIQGVAQIMLGTRVRPADGWGWIVAAGVLAILAGVAILFSLPVSGLVTLGTFAGIAMLFTGITYIYIAMAARRMWRELGEHSRTAAA